MLLTLSFHAEAQNQLTSVQPAAGDINLKVLMWNILGKRNLESYFDVNGTTGRDRMIEIIKETEADIVCMTETYGSAVDISAATGFHYWTPDPTANLTIFSRYPLENAGIVPGLSLYSFIRATVVLPDNRKVKFYNIWLTSEGRGINQIKNLSISDQAFNEGDDNRADQLLQLLNHSELQQDLANQDEIPVIIAGDFNCVSHLDYTAATKAAGLNFGRVLDCRASKDMANKGFTDTYRYLHPTITKSTLGHTWETWKSPDTLFTRIDFIYSAGAKLIPLESKNLVYYKNNTTQHWPYWPSDHGAVFTSFNFKSTINSTEPTALFDVVEKCGSTTYAVGDNVQFIDKSLDSPTDYLWTFEGGTPSSSTDQNPSIVYNTTGTFDVELKVSNSIGSDNLLLTDYITIKDHQVGYNAYTYINFYDGIQDLSKNKFNLTSVDVNLEDTYRFSDSTMSYGVFGTNSKIEIDQGDLSECLPQNEFTASCLVYKKSTEAYGGYLGYFQDNGSFERGMILGNLNQKFSIGLCTENNPGISYLTAPNNYELNQWYHVAITYDGSMLRMFVDGEIVLENTNEGGKVLWPTAGWYVAGRYKDNDEDFGMNGYLDEINLLSEALSPEGIKSMYEDLKVLSVGQHPTINEPQLSVTVANGKLLLNLNEEVQKTALYSSRGELIMQTYKNEKTINISSLPIGIYIVQVQLIDGTLMNRKVVLKK